MNSKLTVGTAYTAAMTEAASRVLSAAAVTSESPFDLVGYSLGAGVAAFIAAEHPEVVRSLVLISGFAYGGDVWMKLQFNLWLDLLRTDRIALTRLLLLTGLSRDFVSNMDEDTMAAAIHAFATSSDWESIQRAIRLDRDCRLDARLRLDGNVRKGIIPAVEGIPSTARSGETRRKGTWLISFHA